MAAIAWILGIGAAVGGGYLLLKKDKKEKKSSARERYELIFGRMSLAVKQCGPMDTAAVEDVFDMSLEAGYPELERLIRNHCPQVFEVPKSAALQEGRVTIQAIATTLGIINAMGDFCVEVLEGPQADQVEAHMRKFTADLTSIGPLGAVTTFRGNMVGLCPAIDSLTGEELQRRGNNVLIDLGVPAT